MNIALFSIHPNSTVNSNHTLSSTPVLSRKNSSFRNNLKANTLSFDDEPIKLIRKTGPEIKGKRLKQIREPWWETNELNGHRKKDLHHLCKQHNLVLKLANFIVNCQKAWKVFHKLLRPSFCCMYWKASIKWLMKVKNDYLGITVDKKNLKKDIL